MASANLQSLLDKLDRLKTGFEPTTAVAMENLLGRIANRRFTDIDTLIRYHELLLFVRAYPHNSQIVKLTEKGLESFAARIEKFRALESDLSALETPEVSGISGTSVTDTFTYPIVRWLNQHQPKNIELDWEWFEDENRLAETWPRFMPLLEEDAAVEANVPYQTWLKNALGRRRAIDWLIARFNSREKTETEKAELFNSQKLYVRWTPAYKSSRTGMRLGQSKIHYHRQPLIQRREVSFHDELSKPSPPLELLSTRQGEAVLNLAREASTVRYRELYGFTHGDAGQVLKADIGRGVEIFITSLPPQLRLPLRAYHAAMIFKNGIAVGYFEGLSLFERMESGFNLYYTFRDGETAWLYARTLNIFHHLTGVTAFAIDPYQIGYENEEGIESGAFWFYRKLGFRPTVPEIGNLMAREEERLSKKKGYRTSLASLQKLAKGSMIFELDQKQIGDWDRFQLRNIGLRVQRLMADRFKGDAEKMRTHSIAAVSHELNLNNYKRSATADDFFVTLSMISDLKRWPTADKQLLVRVINAKQDGDESDYLKLMQKHRLLRSAIINLGDPQTHTKHHS